MQLLATEGARERVVVLLLLVAAVVSFAMSRVTVTSLEGVALATIVLAALALGHTWILRWDVLAGALIVVILFIPIRRFVLPGNLPFQLEPYRLLIALLGGAWLTSLLIDPRVRLRRTGLETPLWLFVAAAVASVLFNFDHIATGARIVDPATRLLREGSLDANVLKAFTFFLSFILVLYFIVSLVRHTSDVDRLVKLLVSCGVVIAVLSVVESRTGVNLFDRIPRVLPFLKENFLQDVPDRGARLRARGPAEHAIALSAALAMLVPLGVYLGATTQRLRWWLATAALGIGALAAVSRTGVLMLIVVALVFLCVKLSDTRRFLPALIPVLVAVHFAMPGTLGTLKESFFPPGGLVEEQSVRSVVPGQQGGGRLADVAPSLGVWWERPLVGQGFGTRVVTYDSGTNQVPNAIILDNQWLAALLETGAVGVLALAWLFIRFLKLTLSESRRDLSPRGWLLAAVSASVASLAVGMFVFDALSFVQIAFLLFILLGIGAVVLQRDYEKPHLLPVKLD